MVLVIVAGVGIGVGLGAVLWGLFPPPLTLRAALARLSGEHVPSPVVLTGGAGGASDGSVPRSSTPTSASCPAWPRSSCPTWPSPAPPAKRSP